MNQNDIGKQNHQPLNHLRVPPSIPPPSCPRCASSRTKFCYYNNYSVSQPRYFCKDCRRYWTHGGALRNIPSGGSSRKRGRTDVASSSSQILKSTSSRNLLPSPPPPPFAWTLGSSPDNIQYFNGGGCFSQTTVNTAFGVVSMGFGGGAPPPPPPPPPPAASTQSILDFGYPFLQRPPPTVWGSQNMGLNNARTTLTGSNYLQCIARDPSAAAHVVSIDEWSELNDMDNEGGYFQSYKPPSP